jgi:hypothetical protein
MAIVVVFPVPFAQLAVYPPIDAATIAIGITVKMRNAVVTRLRSRSG